MEASRRSVDASAAAINRTGLFPADGAEAVKRFRRRFRLFHRIGQGGNFARAETLRADWRIRLGFLYFSAGTRRLRQARTALGDEVK
jgi:hypothetical protein